MSSEKSPIIDAWLGSSDYAAIVDLSLHDLSVLNLVSKQKGAPVIPDEGLVEWSRILNSEQTLVDQATISFLDESAKAGWSDERVALTSRLGQAEAITRERSAVIKRLIQRHPGCQ